MLLSLNVLFLGLSLLVVIDAAPVKLDKATSKLIETSYNQGLRSGANNRLAFPSNDGINKIPITLNDYDFPAPVSAPQPQPAPVAVATPAPVKIMKPNLRAGRAHVTNFDYMGLGQTKNAVPLFYIKQFKLKAPVPYNIDVEWQANGRQFSLDSQFTGDHLPTPPPMPEHVVKMLTDLKAAHLL